MRIPPTRQSPDPVTGAAMRATSAVFIGSGFAFASWASRIPQVKMRLGLDPSGLGLLLLAISIGSTISVPLAGSIVARFGSRRTVSATSILLGAGLVVVSIGYPIGVWPVAVGLLMLGLGNGSWDVAMNVQGAAVERRLGRAVMSRFHAGFSLGTVAGALLGAAMVALGVPVTAHLAGAGLVVAIGVPLSTRWFVPDHATGQAADPLGAAGSPGSAGPGPGAGARPGRWAQWRDGRTLLVGVFVLAFAFAEGTGNDWISVAVIDSHHTDAALGTLGYAVFLAAMTAGRWFGPPLTDRYGRVATVRVLAAIGIVGLVAFVFGPGLPLAYAGTLLWGIGASLGFPLGMSAGADDPALATARVSVIASIGYCAFLGGPPLIGFLGDHVTVPHALIVVAALLVLAMVIAGAVRPLQAGTTGRGRLRSRPSRSR